MAEIVLDNIEKAAQTPEAKVRRDNDAKLAAVKIIADAAAVAKAKLEATKDTIVNDV